jgi:hypothetical protein
MSNPLAGKRVHKGTENLVPVVPGEVRNPTGKNQYTDLHNAGLKVLEKGNLEKLLRKLSQLGNKGNVLAIRELLDRVYGKPQQSVDLKGGQDFPKRLEIYLVDPPKPDDKDGANE